MADYSAKVAKMGRIFAIVQIHFGFIFALVGIVQCAGGSSPEIYRIGVLSGIWMCIGGGLGILGTSKEHSTSRDAFVNLFTGFSIMSIISVVLCGIIVFCYSYSDTAYRYRMWGYGLDTAVKIFILTICIAEFFIGIWAAICCCLIKPCMCQKKMDPR